jgi:hypothetical protein
LSCEILRALVATSAFLVGCAHPQRVPQDRQESNGLLLLNGSYDGVYITGLLIVLGDDKLKLDRRLPESASVGVRFVRQCSGERIAHDVADTSMPAPQSEDLLQIGPGFVYGKKVKLVVFGDGGPDCIIAANAVRDYGRKGLPADAGDALYRIGQFQFRR